MGKFADKLKARHADNVAAHGRREAAKELTNKRMQEAAERESIPFIEVKNNLKLFQEAARDCFGLTFDHNNSDSWKRHNSLAEDFCPLAQAVNRNGWNGDLDFLLAWGIRGDAVIDAMKFQVNFNTTVRLFAATADRWNAMDERDDAWEDDAMTVIQIQACSWLDRMVTPDAARKLFKPEPLWLCMPTKATAVKPSEMLEVVAAAFAMHVRFFELLQADPRIPEINTTDHPVFTEVFLDIQHRAYLEVLRDLEAEDLQTITIIPPVDDLDAALRAYEERDAANKKEVNA